ncbi:MAG: hypothetical protein ACRC2B_03245 [Rubrivivax sp.]
MATDDTGTVAAGECQVEIWGEHADAERAQVLAPACGLTDTLELDLGASRTVGSSAKVTGLAAGLKWVPAGATFDTALGTVGLGLEGGLFWARDADQGWRADSVVVVALASLAMGSQWNLYANVLTSRSLSDGRHVHGLRTALSWQPQDRWLLFVESLAASDSSRVRNAGLRWWAVPEVIGLDLITSHSTASGTSVSVGLGWYGIRLP